MRRGAQQIGGIGSFVVDQCAAWSGICSLCGLPLGAESATSAYKGARSVSLRSSQAADENLPRIQPIQERHRTAFEALTSNHRVSPSGLGLLAKTGLTRAFASTPEEGDGNSLPVQSNSGEQASDRSESTLGRPLTTLEARKRYRQEQLRKQRENAQSVAREQAAQSQTLAAKQELRLEAKKEKARVREDEEAEESVAPEFRLGYTAGKLFNNDLTEEDHGKYVFFDIELLPEIFDRGEVRDEEYLPRGGCRNLEEEMEYTKASCVMYRQIIASLAHAVENKQRDKLYLTGPPCSGKSVALACLVNMMRARGWLVWYLPQALQLTHGGFFHENISGQWDTPESARLLLRYLWLGNSARVTELKTKDGRLITEVIEESLHPQMESKVVVDNFLAVQEAVLDAEDVLVAIDNYQALYRPSEYGQWLSQHKRRSIDPSELRVASSMQLLDKPKPLKNGVVVCASSRSGQYSPKMKIPTPHESLFNIPNFTLGEFGLLADFYMLRGTTQWQSNEDIKTCYWVLGANPKELKMYAGNLDWSKPESNAQQTTV